MDPHNILPGHKKKRSHTKGLITKQGTRICERVKKIKSLDQDFKQIHFEIFDSIDETDETAVVREWEIVSLHDDQIESKKLLITQHTMKDKKLRILNFKLCKLKGTILSTKSTINDIDDDSVNNGLLGAIE